MEDAYPDRTTVSDRTIDSHVKRIRRKFVAADPEFARIEGVYGAGYRYGDLHDVAADETPRPSGIGLRLLAFNLLVVFVPVIGVLYLDVYESRLRQSQEAGLAQQARVLAAALGDRPLWMPPTSRACSSVSSVAATHGFRVYDQSGGLLADSARQASESSTDERTLKYTSDDGGASAADGCTASASGSPLSAATGRPSSCRRSRDPVGLFVATPVKDDRVPPEVRAALDGRYGAVHSSHGRAALGDILQCRSGSQSTAQSSAPSSRRSRRGGS